MSDGFVSAEEDLDLGPHWIPGGEVPARADITYRQFDYWVKRGLIQIADRDPLAGSGIPRMVSWREVEVARLMGELCRVGLDLETSHRVAREIRATGIGRLGKFVIKRSPGE